MLNFTEEQIKRILELDKKGPLTNKEAAELDNLLDDYDLDYVKYCYYNLY